MQGDSKTILQALWADFSLQKEEKQVHTHMFANPDKFYGLHVRPTSILWIFTYGAT